jgi:hypothetical protein
MKNIAKKIGISVVVLFGMLLFSGCIFSPEYVEVQVDEALFEEQYYYQQYTDEKKTVYREIYQGLLNQEPEFIVHGTDGEVTNEILFTVLYDFPELFWTDGEVTSTGYEFPAHVVVEPTYVCSKEERAKREQEVQGVAEQIIENIPQGYSEYEKIKYVYEYIVNQVAYVDEAPDNQNIYSSLVRKESVCAGYAKEMQYLLEQMEIPCIYVVGDATSDKGKEAHAWNIVLCNGAYYHVDATWGDPVFLADDTRKDDVKVIYDYLCCSDVGVEKTHEKSTTYEYPVCDSEELDYYRLNHMYYETADKQVLLNAMKQTINQKGASTTFKFANRELYDQASKVIIDELLDTASQYLGRRYRLNYVQCFYREYPENNRFMINWEYK